jgi:8-oxo-dGTP pyrophosphatase MutT (NUDIX family)
MTPSALSAPADNGRSDLRWLHDPERVRARLAAFTPQRLPLQGRKPAAVLMLICEAGHGADIPGLPQHTTWSQEPALLLTRRSARMSRHPGQWALPGGRLDEGESAEQAALRELQEELGVALPAAHVIGRLDDYATHSGYVITPVLACAGAACAGVTQALHPNPDEVASVHRLPICELLREDAPLLNQPRSGGAPILRMPVGRVWIAAPTAAFLLQLREWLIHGRATRVAHFEQPYFARR